MKKIVFLNKQNNICCFKYELSSFYDFTWRIIAIGQYYIHRNKWKYTQKQMKKYFFPQYKAFLYSKNGS